MAEKEERIVCRIIEKGYACDYCFSRPTHKYYQCSISNNDCTYDVCKQCSLGMTRAEAIERMANAINVAYLNRNPDYIMHFGLLAEAALNALLEGK